MAIFLFALVELKKGSRLGAAEHSVSAKGSLTLT
jgi:hypothetical protein